MHDTSMLESIQKTLSEHAVDRHARMTACYENIDMLRKVILDEVSPHVIELGGGSGFFMTPTWLTSNAHVHANPTALSDDLDTLGMPQAKLSYFRPAKAGNHPDLMFAEINNPVPGSLSLIPTSDQFYPRSYFFYIDVYQDETDPDHIIFVTPSDELNFNLTRAADAGISGSPLVEAKLTYVSGAPKWIFQVKSVVFAQKELTLMTMPILPDLDQIMSILILRSEQDRAAQITQLLTSPDLEEQKIKYLQYAEKLAEQLAKLETAYSTGECDYLVIRHPDAEELKGKRHVNFKKSTTICNLTNSALITREQSPVDLETLNQSISTLLTGLKGKMIQLDGSNHSSSQAEFRLDFETVWNNKLKHRLINIQDNTNKRPTRRKASNSQVFANVKISSQVSRQPSIDGSLLEELLSQSMESKMTVLYPAEDFTHIADSETGYRPKTSSQPAGN